MRARRKWLVWYLNGDVWLDLIPFNQNPKIGLLANPKQVPLPIAEEFPDLPFTR